MIYLPQSKDSTFIVNTLSNSVIALSGLNFPGKFEDLKLNLKSSDKIREQTIFLSDGEEGYSIQLSIPIL